MIDHMFLYITNCQVISRYLLKSGHKNISICHQLDYSFRYHLNILNN